jgi:hypothetical protein
MLQLHESADESTFHLCQHGANVLLLLVQVEKLLLHRFVQFAEIRPADRITDRDQNIAACLDQYALIDGRIDLAVGLRFIGQNPRRQGCRAVESVRQESERALERLGHDSFYVRLLDEDLKREENLEVNGR